ncbi:TerB family tellurite resistance protein, partial [Roseibium sp.]
DEEAVDLYGFTSVLKRTTDEAERLAIVEMMWEIVYADGHVHEFEDNTIWRVAELLGVSTRDRMSLRHKVAQTAPEEGDVN